MLEEIYQDKVNKIIKQEDFEKIYYKKQEERKKFLNEINNIEYEIGKLKEELEKVNLDKLLKEKNEILGLENITNEMYEKFIDKIEFDNDKNIFVKFKFEKYLK